MTMIALLPGDGIGSEVLDGPVSFLKLLAAEGFPIELSDPLPYGTSGWLETGSILPDETIAGCHAADVILSGAVGTHPGVDTQDCPNPEAALIELRHLFDLRVSVRSVLIPGSDEVTIVRNITGGAYVDRSRRTESDGTSLAVDPIELCPDRVREVMTLAAAYAAAAPGRRYMSVDKASVYATSRLWRRIAIDVSAQSGIGFDNVNVDRAAFELVKYKRLPGVIATEGLFGDILSDIVCARAGSPALCGSSTINPDCTFGAGATALFEPAHGTSPNSTGTRKSNPTGAWLSLAALFDWCPGLRAYGLGHIVRTAIDRLYATGARTYDLMDHTNSRLEMVNMDHFNSRVLNELKATVDA